MLGVSAAGVFGTHFGVRLRGMRCSRRCRRACCCCRCCRWFQSPSSVGRGGAAALQLDDGAVLLVAALAGVASCVVFVALPSSLWFHVGGLLYVAVRTMTHDSWPSCCLRCASAGYCHLHWQLALRSSVTPHPSTAPPLLRPPSLRYGLP
jgi:hypothetical protein